MTIEIQYMILAQCTICSRIWSGTAYIKSGHLLPLTADGAEADFPHSFRTPWIAP